MHRVRGVLLATGLALVPTAARAGGFTVPDNGTQALGRGATFVAKADDPTAIYYNPAGLARQRGTKLLLDANIFFHSYEFRRAGSFPDDPNDPATPWGGKPFPAVTNAAGPFTAPFLAVTTDFGYFDRLTFGAGIFGPPAIGNRTFPLGVRNAPAASRYDYVQSRSLVLYPTLSAAFRITPWLDVGLAGSLVIGKFDQTTVSYADVSAALCKNAEYQPCDSKNTLNASGTAFQPGLGVTVRPTQSLQFGLVVKTPFTLTAQGTLTPESPRALQAVKLDPGAATVSNKFPLEVRAGGRYIVMDGEFELYDLELDIAYEGWSAAQAQGPTVNVPVLGTFKDINSTVLHGYKDTLGVRFGGAYNLEIIEGLGTVRAGGYFDSSATDAPYTRLDFDTLAKIAGTLGIGYRQGPVTIDLAYAAVASIPRVVGSGQGAIRPVNGSKNGDSVDNAGNRLPAVNEGAFRGFSHIVSLGVTVSFDAFFASDRKILFGNPWEPGFAGEAPPKATDHEKDAEEKVDEEPKKPDDDVKKKPDEDRKKVDEDRKKVDEPPPKKKPPTASPPDEKKKPPTPPVEEKKPGQKDWWENLE